MPDDLLLKTIDGGATWTSGVLLTGGVEVLTIDSRVHTTVYAATRNEGVKQSVDGGHSWFPIGTGITSLNTRKLALDPTASTLYVGTHDRGLFKSVDGGATWRSSSIGMAAAPVFGMVLDPWAPGTVYAAGDAGVHRTGDYGRSWQPRNTGLVNKPTASGTDTTTITSVVLDLWAPATIYVGTDGDGVLKTINGGFSWQRAGLSDKVIQSLAPDLYHPGTIYAGVSDGLYKTVDGGAQWALTGLTSLDVQNVALDPGNPDVLYALTHSTVICGGFPPSTCHHAGVQKSTDAGATWTRLSLPTQNSIEGVLAIDPVTPAIVYAAFDQSVYRTIDGGAQWEELPLQVTFRAIAIDPVTPATLYVASRTSGVWKSTDSGGHWLQITDGLTDLDVRSLLIDRWIPSIVYAGTWSAGVFLLSQP